MIEYGTADFADLDERLLQPEHQDSDHRPDSVTADGGHVRTGGWQASTQRRRSLGQMQTIQRFASRHRQSGHPLDEYP